MDMKKIAGVIVTYNRKDLLKRCLDAVASQTFKPHTVFITEYLVINHLFSLQDTSIFKVTLCPMSPCLNHYVFLE